MIISCFILLKIMRELLSILDYNFQLIKEREATIARWHCELVFWPSIY